MGGGLKTRGIENLSGFIANVNQSGQLAVEAVVNVGAVSAGISGQLVYIAASDSSGVFTPVPITQSGGIIDNAPYKLIVGFSGDTVSTSVSGDVIIGKISGETVSIAGGVTISGNVVNTSISGNVVNITDQRVRISGDTVSVAGLAGLQVTTSVSGNVVNTSVSGNVVQISGQTIRSETSGETAYLVSGQNTVQLISGFNIVKTSGQTHISKISGETVIAQISGQFVNTSIDLSGVTLNVDNITTNVSGQVVVGEISGQTIRFGTSGFSNVNLQAYDYSGNTWNNLAVSTSGGHSLNVAASFQADISGQTVRTFAASGQNAVYLTNQSGNLAVIVDASGRLAVTNSGVTVSVLSGTGIRISGETIVLTSGAGVRISGETVALTSGAGVRISGETVALTSGAGVRISGETVAITSGAGVRISGETVALWGASGRNPIYITNQSGTLPVIIDASGRMAVTISGGNVTLNQTVTATVSGNAVNVSGNTVTAITSVSGNVVTINSGAGVRISGETISQASGTGVRISGETVIARISGETVTAANTVSGNIPIASLSTISGVALMAVEPTMTFFMAYQTLMITAASGGAALLSGDSRVVTVRNIGQSGSIMFVGSSGTSRAPWVATEFSGWGYQLKDGDSLTMRCFNPAVVRVVSLTSGQPVSYAINNY